MTGPVLAATTCVLPKRGRGESPLDLWDDIADALCALNGAVYQRGRARYRLLLADTAQASPDHSVLHFRTLNLHPRIKHDLPTLLDMEAGSWFCAPADTTVPLRSADIRDSRWVRAVSAIPLAEHLRVARSAAAALKKAGWALERAELQPLSLDAPRIVVRGAGQHYGPDRCGPLAREALAEVDPPDVGVYQLDGGTRGTFEAVEHALGAGWAAVTHGRSAVNVRRVAAPPADASCATLVLIPDRVDLVERPDLCALLKAWEQQGCRFKLARVATLQNRYSMQNIVFDLAMIAGCEVWQPAVRTTPAVAFDAGHDTAGRRSRWASARVDGQLRVTRLETVDTELAEHIPPQVADRFWPTTAAAMVLRDGRLARERGAFEARAKADGCWLLEVKKHPGALLFRKEAGQSSGARFGDAVVDAHGDVLLQTLNQGAGDCHHPLRVSLGLSADRDAQLQAFFNQTAVPGLTLFRSARLPGAIYWADLASKLDRTGWTQVIGRGWGLAAIVP